jgi:S1-C subfamily serine protease
MVRIIAALMLCFSACAESVKVTCVLSTPWRDVPPLIIGTKVNDFGNGVVIDGNRVVTAYHVVSSGGEITITAGKIKVSAELEKFSKDDDIAILKISAKLPSFALAKEEKMSVDGGIGTATGQSRKVTSQKRCVKFEGAGVGMSGSPLFNSKMEVLGIVTDFQHDKDNPSDCCMVVQDVAAIRKLMKE